MRITPNMVAMPIPSICQLRTTAFMLSCGRRRCPLKFSRASARQGGHFSARPRTKGGQEVAIRPDAITGAGACRIASAPAPWCMRRQPGTCQQTNAVCRDLMNPHLVQAPGPRLPPPPLRTCCLSLLSASCLFPGTAHACFHLACRTRRLAAADSLLPVP